MKQRNFGGILLVLSALIWGCGLVAQKNGMDHLGPFAFTSIRFILGGISLLPLVWFMDRKRTKPAAAGFDAGSHVPKDYDIKTIIKGSAVCGFVLGMIAFFQQIGISYTTVGKAGFITGLYIIITPLLERIGGKRVQRTVWISAVIGVIGLSLLTLSSGIDSLTLGDILMLGGAFSAALHIIVIDRWVKKIDSVKLSCFQFLFAGVIFIPLAVIFETTTIDAVLDCAVPILYTGLLSCGVDTPYRPSASSIRRRARHRCCFRWKPCLPSLRECYSWMKS